jgi:hypothetical protein
MIFNEITAIWGVICFVIGYLVGKLKEKPKDE